ncbi:MAG: hypothetical protein L6420_06225 [Elusimicrobia bacterium]|nr:hypothetical protein [Elusimicrobiota bacterium]
MKRKLYPIERSPLYNLSNKRTLTKLLNTDKKSIESLLKNTAYKVYLNKKKRLIEEPFPELKKIQSKLNNLLQKIETPSWLKSGKKGMKITDNANIHIKNPYIVCVDIESFYKSVARDKIFQNFKYTFKMTDDVAWLLTNIVVFKDQKPNKYGSYFYIPTGTPCSQLVAYWTYKKTFDDILESGTLLCFFNIISGIGYN